MRAFAFLIAVSGFAQDFVGAGRCAACHSQQSAQQSTTGHARSLAPAAQHPLAGSFGSEEWLTRGPRLRFLFSRDPGELRTMVSDGTGSLEVPVQWAFGAGDQAVTFVSQLDEDTHVEHHFSYYSGPKILAATPGHEDTAPAGSVREAMGVLYKTFDPEPKIMRCFQCHSTGRLKLGPKQDIQPAELGVRCEACHGPGSAHVSKPVRTTIRNPGRLSPAQMNQLCGECHRMPAPAGVATDFRDPWNVRHQPVYFSESACFRKSKRLTCVTCHNPHQPLRKNDAAYYNSKCRTCHAAAKHPPLPVSREDCVQCHMPTVAPHPHLKFVNHWIGVFGADDLLVPIRRN